MNKNSQIDNDELNLIELMYTVWKGKWKIAAAAVISLIVMIIYQSNQTNNFNAITEIKPISSLLFSRYSTFNSLIKSIPSSESTTDADANDNTKKINDREIYSNTVVPKITRERLLNMYINILQNNRSLIENGIREFNLLEASQYNDAQKYNEAITSLASSVILKKPSVDLKSKILDNSYHTIEFVFDDAKKWISVLKYLDEVTNKLVKKNLLKEYNEILLSLAEQRKYALEDISSKINNKLIDYERETSNHLEYLKEQSQIAKQLGITKNTIEVQTFGNQNALLSSIQADTPFYLRGYEAIDKEIELTETRDNKKAFIKGLFELEKKKRAMEQDKTIERTQLIIKSVLLSNNEQFTAASLDVVTTKFVYKDDRIMLVLSIVIGLIVGLFYVIISNAFQSYRVKSKKD